MKRIVTALALVVIASYLVFLAPQRVFILGAITFGCFCYWECATLVAGHGLVRPGVLGLLAGMLVVLQPDYALADLAVLTIVSLIAALRFADLKSVLLYVGSVLLAVCYGFIPWHFAVNLRALSVHLLFFALALNWAGDSIAFYVGRRFGKHKLAPRVSPGKSREGAAAAVIGSVVFGLLYLHFFLPSLAPWKVIVIAAGGNIAGQFGDLAESALKRGAGVKDSGQLLPGHGGMLDRLDSSLFALPAVYLLIEVFTYF